MRKHRLSFVGFPLHSNNVSIFDCGIYLALNEGWLKDRSRRKQYREEILKHIILRWLYITPANKNTGKKVRQNTRLWKTQNMKKNPLWLTLRVSNYLISERKKLWEAIEKVKTYNRQEKENHSRWFICCCKLICLYAWSILKITGENEKDIRIWEQQNNQSNSPKYHTIVSNQIQNHILLCNEVFSLSSKKKSVRKRRRFSTRTFLKNSNLSTRRYVHSS